MSTNPERRPNPGGRGVDTPGAERTLTGRWRAWVESRGHGADDGMMAIMFGLLLIPMMIFTALAIDVSSWYSRATELQRTADAASLAGVVWMPDLGKAKTDATPVLARNGVVDGSGNMSVTMDTGETGITSFKVCVTDNEVTQFFGAVFTKPTKMTRCATAQYNAPLQLGSPLNYFGGNHESLIGFGPAPDNAYGAPPPRSAFGWGRYCWVNEGGVTKGFWDNRNNSNSANWYYWVWPDNNLGGSHPVCGTSAPAVPAEPSGSGCNVPGHPNVYWYRDGSGPFPRGWRYRDRSGGSNYDAGRDCTYGDADDSPIPSQKSPNMWAAIESYNYGHANGDAFSNAGSEYRSTGYWYSVDVPESGVAGDISFQAWDLTYNCILGCRSPMGDTSGSNVGTPVRMRLYKAGPLKFDMSAISPIAGCDTGWVTGTSNAAYDLRWAEICNIASPSPGDRYYVQIQSTSESGFGQPTSQGRGVTGYAVRAVAGTYPAECLEYLAKGDVACYGTGTQPRLSAFGDMEMYNGIDSGQPTQFYLADVTPMYAGKTLEILLFDPGDGAGSSWVSIRGPDATGTEGVMIPASNCTVHYRNYGSSNWNPVGLSNGPGGTYPDTCTVQTTTSSTNTYNDRWLRFRIDLPSSYGPEGDDFWTKCDPTVEDPTTTGGSCWWQISYYVGSGQLGDYTTWSAGIINDPVRLVR